MKKLFLLILGFAIINIYASYAQNIECKKANKEVCGYDSWECSAQKCFIKNEDNLEQAFKFYLQYLMQEQKQITEKYNEKKICFCNFIKRYRNFLCQKLMEVLNLNMDYKVLTMMSHFVDIE